MRWAGRPKRSTVERPYGITVQAQKKAFNRTNLVPEGRWGIVVLGNAIDLLHFQRIDNLAVGVMSLLLARPLSPAPFEIFWVIFLAVLAVCVLQVIGIIRSVRLRRWRAEPTQRPLGVMGMVRQIGLSTLLNLAWVGFILWIEGGVTIAIVPILALSDLGWVVPGERGGCVHLGRRHQTHVDVPCLTRVLGIQRRCGTADGIASWCSKGWVRRSIL